MRASPALRSVALRRGQSSLVARLLLAGLLGGTGCARDRVLPVESVCGNHRVEEGEECDADGEGCLGCRLTPGFQCAEGACAPVCGDGRIVGDEECDPPDDVTCDRSCKAASNTGCNIDGYFIVHQVNYSRDTVVNQVQTASNWYFYRFSQEGDAFVAEEALYCGLLVTGTVTVSLDEGGYRALLRSNPQGRLGAHGPRRGRFVARGDRCELSFDRWYLVRGVEDRFLPADFLGEPRIADLPALPHETDPLHPTGEYAAGATDADGDGRLGIGLHVTGALPGLRSVVHRDWDEYLPDAAHPNATGAIEIAAGCDFDNEENILSVGDCDGAACGLLLAGSAKAQDLPSSVTFRYLGKTLEDPRVAAFASAPPGADETEDLATCARVRAALPHEGGPR